MNQAEAIAKLGKLLGPKFGYRVDKHAPACDEERDRQRAERIKAKRAAESAVAARKARCDELLAADPLYQRLKAEAVAATKAAETAGEGAYRYRITVGRTSSLFFGVEAQGDNWADVVERVISSRQPKKVAA